MQDSSNQSGVSNPYNALDTRGKIVVADDKYMNIHALRDYLIELKYIDRVEFRSNGQEVVDYVKELVQKALSENSKH
jgi:PleD family two-component response regulator